MRNDNPPTRKVRYRTPKLLTLPITVRGVQLPERTLNRELREGTICRVTPGIYGPPVIARAGENRYEQEVCEHLVRISAAAWNLQDNETISHLSAGVLWGIDGAEPPIRVHSTRPVRSGSNGFGRRRFHAAIPTEHLNVDAGIPVTSLARTAVDCMRVLPAERALADAALLFGADRRQLIDINQALTLPRMRRQTDELLRLASPNVDSPKESELRLLALYAGVPHPIPQLEVVVDGNVYYLDVGDPDLMLALEYDGKSKYRGEEALYKEKIRQENLERAGWRVIRTDAQDIWRANRLIREIHAHLRRHGITPQSQLSGWIHMRVRQR
jgi:hypothetical protein